MSHILLAAFLLQIIAQLTNGNPGPYGQYPKTHYPSSQPYLPAPNGKRPACAGDSDTFCDKIDYYPT